MIKYNNKTYYSPEEITNKFTEIRLIDIYKAISDNKIIYIGGGVLSYLIKKKLDSNYYIFIKEKKVLTKNMQIRLLELQAKKDGIFKYFKNCSLLKDYYKIACEK